MNNWMPQTSQNLILNNRVNRFPPKAFVFEKPSCEWVAMAISSAWAPLAGSTSWGPEGKLAAGRQSSARPPAWALEWG